MIIAKDLPSPEYVGGDLMKLIKKLERLQKKYPQQKLRALVIEDSDLNFTFTFRGHIGITAIESNRYNGILYQRITQDRTNLANPQPLKIELIVQEKVFLMSVNRAIELLNRYGI